MVSKRKISRKGIIKKLDALVKEIVFQRDGRCVTCPLWKQMKPDFKGGFVMQAGHFITRSSKSIRWDLRNVYQQCRTCNFLHELHPEVMAEYVRSILGDAEFKQLIFDGNQVKPIKIHKLVELYENLSKAI